jgi:acyl-coenzyme A thioesterase PaaI-like protein
MIDLKNTLAMRVFGFFKIPLIFFVRPRVIHLSQESCEICIPLKRRNRNHLGSMYFGVLCTGADCAGGLIAVDAIRKSSKKVSSSFKSMKVEFLKRAEADVHFTCNNGKVILDCLAETLKTKKRIEQPILVIATTPKISGDEPVARFEMILSMRAY